MPLLTVVEHYATAALGHAIPEDLEDGGVGATIPGFPGIIAMGADNHECAMVLYALVIEWVKVSLASGRQLPVIDGIDLNTESSHILATYHEGNMSRVRGRFFEDDAAFEAALDELNRTGLEQDHGSS